jgi:O-antigen/teichoic acid export membrane protein
MSRLKIAKNSFANLCRGSATALVILILPPFLTRFLSKDSYGTWLLILQLSSYVSFLDFGIQTAVGRYVAHFNKLGDTRKRDSVVSTSLAILFISGMLAMLGVMLLTWQLPNLFRDMPIEFQQDAQIALLLVGGSLAIALPFNVFGAIFIGLQRYDIPAWIVGISKLLGGGFIVLVAYFSHDIVLMSIVMGIANLLTGFWQYLAYKKMAYEIKVSVQKVSRQSAIEIANYCYGLLVWSVGMMLVSGLDTAIIGYFDYKSVVYYTLAASITTFVTGIQGSIFATILPNAAEINAKGDREGLGKLLVSSTRYAAITLVMTSVPLIVGSKWLLTVWVGESYAIHTQVLLQLLVIANFIRQLGIPYAVITVGVGEQKLVMLSPLIEGVTNMLVSVFLVNKIGVIGVAIGTITGGFISILCHFFYNLPRTKSILLKDTYLLCIAVGKPLLSLIPLTLLYPLLINLNQANFTAIDIIVTILILLLTIIMLYYFAITSEEKSNLILFIKQKTSRNQV